MPNWTLTRERKKKAVKNFRSRLKWLYLCLSMHEFQIKSLFWIIQEITYTKGVLDVILTTSAHRSRKQWHQRQWRQLVKLIVFRLKYSFYNIEIQQLLEFKRNKINWFWFDFWSRRFVPPPFRTVFCQQLKNAGVYILLLERTNSCLTKHWSVIVTTDHKT